MIKFENTEVFNWDGAIRGMRNPLNSWDKSDSSFCKKCVNTSINVRECPLDNTVYDIDKHYFKGCYILGGNDLALAQRLIKAGSDHRKFLRQIFVSVDITAPLYWWKEFDTYKVGTVANSCSTMHTIHKKEFTFDDFSHEYLVDGYVMYDLFVLAKGMLLSVIDNLNYLREIYLKTKDSRIRYQLIQLLPSSYNQKRTVTLNYEVLRNIRHSDRRNHKLDEWRIGFMEWIDSLPYAEELLKI